MARFSLKRTDVELEVGWRVRLIVEFEAVADNSEESFWVRVASVDKNKEETVYSGMVEDYLTFVRSHGITQGFILEFQSENVCEIQQR
jgi:hypothetical protein